MGILPIDFKGHKNHAVEKEETRYRCYVVQQIDTLQTDAEKGRIALAIKVKIGPKAFKKNKRKDYLLQLIDKAGSD